MAGMKRKAALKRKSDPDLRAALEAKLVKLNEQLAQLEGAPTRRRQSAKRISSQGGAILQPGSSVSVQDGQFAGRDLTIIHNRYEGPPPKKKADQRRIYLDVLACLVNRLPMRAFDTSQSNPSAAARELSLVNVYTTLDTTGRVISENAETRKGKSRQPELPEGGETRPLRALEAAACRRRLVLLGEPGSGKTTFIHHLIYCLARNQVEGDAPWLGNFQRDWPAADRDLLPIRVILRDFDMWLAEAGRQPGQVTPRDLRDFIDHLLAQQNLDFASELVDEALHAGKALVVLDGLDEVASLRRRELVRDAIVAFADLYRQSRFLITCRTWSYQPPEEKSESDLRLPEMDFPIAQLAPFDDEKIDQFLAAWHNELVNKQKLSRAKADVLRPKLMRAVRQPDLRRLAGNPLQLTLMAWAHTDDEELPDKRAQLYAKAVDLLLWRWEMQKPDAPGVQTLRGYATEVTDGDGKGKIEQVLWRAAFEAHALLTPEAQRENPERTADVDEMKLKKELARLKKDAQGKPDENWARDVVDALRERSGLLARRLPGTLTFPHRTFQEYLAALWLLQDRFVTQAGERADQFDLWREVILLAVGHSVYVQKDYELTKPLALVRKLCPAACEDMDVAWRKVWLAGDALIEMGMDRAVRMDDETTQRVRTHLAELVSGGKLAPAERAGAGITLGRMGDPRDLQELVPISGGRFWMGSDKSRDPDARDDEARHEVFVPAFKIGKNPVTVGQWRQFVESAPYPEGDPHALGDPANHPVAHVSWHDAIAYCRWLTGEWRQAKKIGSDEIVRLPTEAEWEKAARGVEERIWPWGNKFDENKANTGITGIFKISAVGCFPAGASPYGVMDMAGNVWEWCSSKYKTYPYRREDGRESTEGDERRVVRGGSFFNSPGFVRCAFRDGYRPVARGNFLGFRVVVVSPGSRF